MPQVDRLWIAMKQVKIKQRAIAEAESELMRQVRLSESASRIELARQLNLAPSTVGLYVDRLISEGYLREERKPTTGSGRPPVILELEPQAGEFVGIDFEASQIALTSVDFSQRILQQSASRILASDSPTQVVDKIEQAIATSGRRHRLLGIGVAVPGVIDHERGMAVHYEHIRGWENVPIVEQLSKRFKAPVYIENNVRAMALAEQWFGKARGLRNFICVGIRSGIGAGIVVNGELHSGHDGLAGEIGGWPCAGPSAESEFTTLENVASVRSILGQLTGAIQTGAQSSLVLKRNRVGLDDMLQGAADGDPLVLQTLELAARAVGLVVTQMSLLLNPEQVIIAGPLAGLTDAFVRPLAAVVQAMSPSLHARAPRIEATEFGQFGGALGAAALAVHQWKPSR